MSASHARRRRWAQRHDDLARLLALALIERGVKRRQKLNRQVELGFELFSRSASKAAAISSALDLIRASFLDRFGNTAPFAGQMCARIFRRSSMSKAADEGFQFEAASASCLD
jgi:hypothetical protein